MSWTTPQDIKDRWISGKMLPLDTKLSTLIKDVEAQIHVKYPAINTRISAGDISVDNIVSNVSRILIEFLLTEGTPYQQEAQSYSGIGSRSVSVSSSARKSLLLTEADLVLFGPPEPAGIVAVTMTTNRCKPHYLGWEDNLIA